MPRKNESPREGATPPVRADLAVHPMPAVELIPMPGGDSEASSTRISLDVKIPGFRLALGWIRDLRRA